MIAAVVGRWELLIEREDPIIEVLGTHDAVDFLPGKRSTGYLSVPTIAFCC